jgi:hypothetical protein
MEVLAGTLVFLHDLLPHYRTPDQSTRSRDAYVLHMI